MINLSGGSNSTEDIITVAAQLGRTLHAGTSALVRTSVLFMAVLVGAYALADLDYHTGNRVWEAIATLALQIVGHLGWLGLPVLASCGWLIVAQIRAEGPHRKLDDLVATRHSDLRRSVSVGAIGPLLDMRLTGMVSADASRGLRALLEELLASVRAEDHVVLTANQRRTLHLLVIEEPSVWFNLRFGLTVCESDRDVLRPAAINALAALGNRSSIPVLERFARKTDDPILRATALQSVEQIRARSQYGPEQMLRASAAPERPEILLRASSPEKPQSQDQNQLLRAEHAVQVTMLGEEGQSR